MNPTRSHRRAFTMVELLMVIGIILVLLGILLPGATSIYNQAARNRVRFDFLAIGQALDAYKSDFGFYPICPQNISGDTDKPRLLVTALIGPGTPGFYVTPGGPLHPNYLPSDRFQYSTSDLLDRYGLPIRYYPLYNTMIDPASGPLVDQCPSNGAMYDYRDAAGGGADTTQRYALRAILGDINFNNKIDAGETLRYSGPYILWSAGPDKVFLSFQSNDPVTTVRQTIQKSKNVLNFNFQ